MHACTVFFISHLASVYVPASNTRKLSSAMADSDEEQERGRSRDKFPKERSDYRGGDRNRSKNDVRERRTWRDDDSSSRRRSRDDFEGDSRRHYSGGGYNRGGRDWSPPPAKRMRRDHW